MKNDIKFKLWGRVFVLPAKVKIIAVIIVAVVAIIVGFYLLKKGEKETMVVTVAPSATPSPSQVPATPIPEIFVYVVGEVLTPGVYKLSSGCMVSDAVAAAGGLTEKANPEAINMVEILTANTMINVPAEGEVASGPVSSLGNTVGGKININTAGIDELCTLSGVGESTAKKIISYRESNGPFVAIEDIMNVPGIKEARFLAIKEDICVG